MDFDHSEWKVDTAADTLTQQLFGSPHIQLKKRSKKRKLVDEQPAAVKTKKQKKTSKAKLTKQDETGHYQKPNMDSSVSISNTQKATKLNKVKHGKKRIKKENHDGRVTSETVPIVESKNEHRGVIQERTKAVLKQKHNRKPNIVDKNSNVVDKDLDGENGSRVRSKKKRVRICKRNKFKAYIKPHLDDNQDVDLNDSLSAVSRTDTNKLEVKKDGMDKNDFLCGTQKKHKLKKNINVAHEVDLACDSKTKHSSGASVSVKHRTSSSDSQQNKGKHLQGAKYPFDPEKLSAILSMKNEKSSKQISKNNNKKGETDTVKHGETDKNTHVKKENKSQKSFIEKSVERLNAARFRYLNERLYTSTGHEALRMFRDDRQAFRVYHTGFQGQVEKWPSNPVEHIIADIRDKPRHFVVADFGCGDAAIARSVPNKVHSFDLVSLNEHVTVCDMSKVPLREASVDVAVFCLSLMGTNLADYIREANRVLRQGGMLKIAEVTSRVVSVGQFVLQVEKMGFKLIKQDSDNKMFVLMDFRKTRSTKKGEATSDIKLLPCVYKKR